MQQEQDSSQRLQQDLLRQLRRDLSLHPVLQVDLHLVIVLKLALGRAPAVALPLLLVPAVEEAVLVLDL
jgi:hypothetical protein